MQPKNWWKKAVVYQIYPLSFKDSNGDGIGDIQGIKEKLSHLVELGVDVIWLSPVYQSPMDDNGYDISDYYHIDPIFGTDQDFISLLEAIHQAGLKVIMDLVVNHTSDEHIWFQEAKKSTNNPYRDYYIWRDQPTDIQSVFSGSAWEKDPLTNQYYFHLFSKKQPDLNWDNPLLRQEIYQMINYWLDLGIDGFRLDVIDLIGKDIDSMQICDGPTLDERLRELHQHCFAGRNVLTVGECPCLSLERVKQITGGEDALLSMVFQFGHMSLDEIPHQGKWALQALDIRALKQYFQTMQQSLHQKGWNSLFFSNHDQVRALSRFASEEVRYQSQTMLFTILFGLQGTPYIYQGEEIGMTGIRFEKVEDYHDIETLNMAKEKRALGWTEDQILKSIYKKGRDNSRTPMQWDSSVQAGFTSGTPWLKVNPNYLEINVEREKKATQSIFQYTKKLLQIRKSIDVFLHGSTNFIQLEHPYLFLYTRQWNNNILLIIGNFCDSFQTIDLQHFHIQSILLTNDSSVVLQNHTNLPPYYAAIVQVEVTP